MAENTQLEVLWTKIKERAEKLINPISYSTFVESLTPVDVVNRKIVLQAVTEQGANVVVTHHLDKLREAVASADVGLSDVAIIVEGSKTYTLNELPDAVEEQHVILDKRYTFDSFVEGTSNKFVLAAAKSVAQAPGENFNPLYIYGGSGLGKTHLLQAIANEIAEKKPSLKVLYTTSETFFERIRRQHVFQTRRQGYRGTIPQPLPQRRRTHHRRHSVLERRGRTGSVFPYV